MPTGGVPCTTQAETQAQQVAELCRCVGAAAWACALAVLLVDVHTVAAFRALSASAWEQFVQLTLSDPSYAFLHEVLTVLSGDGDGTAVLHPLPSPGAVPPPLPPAAEVTRGPAGRASGLPPYMQAISEGEGSDSALTSAGGTHAVGSSQGLQGLVDGDIGNGMQMAVAVFSAADGDGDGAGAGVGEAEQVALAASLAAAVERLPLVDARRGVHAEESSDSARSSESGARGAPVR